jgi:RNA polymerase sigma factor (sigma-70 family)
VYHPFITEQELLSDLASGKRAAAERIYSQHHPTVTRWVQGNGGDVAESEDIFQEAMVVLFEKSRSEDFRLSCKIGTYLFSIAKHLWFKRLQALKKQPGFLPDDAGNADEADWAWEDDIQVHQEREMYYSQLDAALGQLGEPCGSLLKAYYHQDKSMQEIAAEFGYTNPDNAKTQKYKCLTRLRKIFYGMQAQ